jgi:transposase
VERVLSCTPDQRVCKCCGKETVVVGYEESLQLDVEPAKYFVLVTRREKRACRSCEELGVASAPLPLRIVEKCLASDRIVVDTVVGKYCNHTPLHRQSVILKRDIGLEISRATLDGWVQLLRLPFEISLCLLVYLGLRSAFGLELSMLMSSFSSCDPRLACCSSPVRKRQASLKKAGAEGLKDSSGMAFWANSMATVPAEIASISLYFSQLQGIC